MPELVFFYGTLMTPFHRTARLTIDQHLTYRGCGTIEAALFDLGIYPAAIPVSGARVHGELYEMRHPTIVLRILDELEGYRPGEHDKSLYTRTRTRVVLNDGSEQRAWAYFYNAPLGRAERIESGDYLGHLTAPLEQVRAQRGVRTEVLEVKDAVVTELRPRVRYLTEAG